MTMDPSQFEIHNNAERNCFEIDLGDATAFAEYMIAGKNIIFTHTEVPPAYEGRGIAGRLAHHALEYARSEGFKVQALCPYIAAYIRRHPEYQSITWGY